LNNIPIKGMLFSQWFNMLTFAKKIGMTQLFDEKGRLLPVTVVKVQKTVVAKKSENDSDRAFFAMVVDGAKTPKSITSAYKIEGIKKVVESKLDRSGEYKYGDEIKVDCFATGDIVSVCATSKGKGFAGTVKRHGFNTGPKTHGSCNYRKPGSIGDTGPQKVVKGKRMGGKMGAKQVSVRDVEILRADTENNNLWLKGPIPGPNKSVLIIKK